MSAGEAILFLDLSADPGLFEGPKGDKQVNRHTEYLPPALEPHFFIHMIHLFGLFHALSQKHIEK